MITNQHGVAWTRSQCLAGPKAAPNAHEPFKPICCTFAGLPWRKKGFLLVTRPIMIFELINVETILEAFRG